MKLNLKCGNNIKPDYINIDIFPNTDNNDTYCQGDIKSLNWIVKDDTVDEILAIDCLEYLPTDMAKSALTNWTKKLTFGGTLKILVPDCHAVAKAFCHGQFNLQEFSQIIFGTRQGNDVKESIIDSVTLLSWIKEVGLTISLIRYEGIAIYLEATK